MSFDNNLWLMHGDCLERMKEIPDGSVDMVLTDPPYGTMKGINCDGYGRKDNDGHMWDEVLDNDRMWSEINRVLRVNGCCILFSQEPYTSRLIVSAHGSIPFAYRMAWVKDTFGNHLLAKKAPVSYYEDVCVFFKAFDSFIGHPLKPWFDSELEAAGMTREDAVQRWGSSSSHYFTDGRQFRIPSAERLLQMQADTGRFQMAYAEMKEAADRFRAETRERFPKVFNLPEGERSKSNLLHYAKDRGSFHPTQKPVALLEDLIKTYTNEGATVLDFTMGSGSTGVAALNCGRKFIGIERDDAYFEIAQRRIEDSRGQMCEAPGGIKARMTA